MGVWSGQFFNRAKGVKWSEFNAWDVIAFVLVVALIGLSDAIDLSGFGGAGGATGIDLACTVTVAGGELFLSHPDVATE